MKPGAPVRLQQPAERQDPLGELSAQPSADCVGFGESVGGDQQRGVFGDFLGCQGAELGDLIQEETIGFGVSEVAVGTGVGRGVQGQEPCGGAQLLLAQLPVADDLLRPAGDLARVVLPKENGRGCSGSRLGTVNAVKPSGREASVSATLPERRSRPAATRLSSTCSAPSGRASR